MIGIAIVLHAADSPVSTAAMENTIPYSERSLFDRTNTIVVARYSNAAGQSNAATTHALSGERWILRQKTPG